jgi:hypothetical protein
MWLCGASLLAMTLAVAAAGEVTEAHAGTRKGTVYKATPAPAVMPGNAQTPGVAAGGAAPADNAAPRFTPSEGGSAPVEPGPGVEIITGGGSSAGAAKVGHLPVLQ